MKKVYTLVLVLIIAAFGLIACSDSADMEPVPEMQGILEEQIEAPDSDPTDPPDSTWDPFAN